MYKVISTGSGRLFSEVVDIRVPDAEKCLLELCDPINLVAYIVTNDNSLCAFSLNTETAAAVEIWRVDIAGTVPVGALREILLAEEYVLLSTDDKVHFLYSHEGLYLKTLQVN